MVSLLRLLRAVDAEDEVAAPHDLLLHQIVVPLDVVDLEDDVAGLQDRLSLVAFYNISK